MLGKIRHLRIKYGHLLLLIFLLASFVAIGAGIGFVVGSLHSLPPYDLANITGELSSFLYDKDDKEVIPLRSDKSRVELDQSEIPEVMKQAIISIEDQRFKKHYGVDLYRLGGAVIANITKGYGSEGASTITQQLAKTAVLKNREKKMRRKIQELYIALQIEHKYSKEQILAFYLNNVNYGHHAWSLQTAAKTYFGKDALDLTLSEAAMLAGVVNAPGRYDPYLHLDNAKKRQALVLNEMVKMEYITKEEAEKAKAESLNLVGLGSNSYQYQSFIDYVIEESAEILDLEGEDVSSLYTAGYRIYTTMDTKTQEAAESVYADDKNFPTGKKGKIIQSAMVVLDPHSGGIRALIGGRKQQAEREFNRAVDATRQPGSSIKPIAVYAPALEKGYGPATVLDDYPERYDTPGSHKTFVNYNYKYRGLVSMRTALQYSINTVAVKMLQKIGVDEGFKFAQSLGITTLVKNGSANDMGLSLALGGLTKGVSPLELTAAYGCFANNGIYVKPYIISKIEDSEGNILYENRRYKTIVMSPQTAYLMSDMLQTVVTAGTAGKAKLSDRPVAGKTGTTSFDVDAWFVGYTPDLVGAVWLGYDKKEKMNNVFGGGYGAPIWKKVMTVAQKKLPPSTFPVPTGIKTITVDYKSGLPPSSLTPDKYIVKEKFNGEYTPSEISNVWIQLPVCADTGQLLTNTCPNSITNTYLKRPIPWTGNIAPLDAAEEPPKEYCTLHGNGTDPSYTPPIHLDGNMQTNNTNHINAVSLNWKYTEESLSTYYRIYRSTNSYFANSPENCIGEVSGTTTWQDNHVSADDEEYYYRIVAYTSGQTESIPSNDLKVCLSEQVNTPLAPKLSGKCYAKGFLSFQIELAWTKSSQSDSVVYYIYRSETPDFKLSSTNQIALIENIDELKWIDKSVKRNKTYYYKVLDVNTTTHKLGLPSNELQITVN
ncbi:MAG: PBP1A family penicillin-binding protein [Clostridia bacterium]|nr:PBP1A family penicillin-binding protein [Clostridia bacterium]